MLRVDKMSVIINQKYIIKDVAFDMSENELLMITGPNGAGKTTLIRAIMHNIKHSGAAHLNDVNIAEISSVNLAKLVGVLTQKHNPQFSFSVREVVALGRYAHKKGIFGKMSDEDNEKIENALMLTGIYNFRDRSVLNLSGGELQRVFLAQVFAQDPKILILDEPTNHLDLQYQISIFDTIKEWVKGEGRSVIAVVHDLNIVYTYGTKALLMNEGRIYSYGDVEDVLKRENLKKVYEVDVAQWMQNLLKHWQ